MAYIRLQWVPPAQNSAGVVGGIDMVEAVDIDWSSSTWFAFVPVAEVVPPETWTTIPWQALQSVMTSSEPIAPPVNCNGNGDSDGGESRHA